MVAKGYVDQVHGVLDLLGEQHVVGGRRGVAAWVVVGHHERDGAELEGRAEDVGGTHGRGEEAAA